MSPAHPTPRPRRARLASAAFVLGAAGLAGLAGCFTIGEGVPPPLDAFYYPTVLFVSPGRTTLYAVNSDFDLQYSGGTVMGLDLRALRADGSALRDAINAAAEEDAADAMKKACESRGSGANDNATLYPGPCAPFPLAPYLQHGKVVTLGAFASGAAIALRPDPCKDGRGARLFVSVRGDPSVTYFDVTDDREIVCDGAALPAAPPCADDICLDCGAESNAGRCSTDHLIGKDPADSQRDITLPTEPFGIAVDERGEAVVVAHQTEQTVSLIVNHWGEKPALEHYLLGGVPPGPTDVEALPIPRIAEALSGSFDYTPAFGVSFRSAPEFDLVRYHDDEGSHPARPFITRSAAVSIAATASSTDSRGVAIDGSERRACEEACPEGDGLVACLRACVEDHPLAIYMANRAPAALVIGRIETRFTEKTGPDGVTPSGAFDVVSFHDSVPLAFGSSRVEMGQVIGADGRPSWRAFAVAFDSRFVFSYDPEARRVDAVIRTGRGPHAIAFDTERVRDESGNVVLGPDGKELWYSTMFVSHFTDSYVGVVDLDMRNQATFGSMYMTLGVPVPPKESK